MKKRRSWVVLYKEYEQLSKKKRSRWLRQEANIIHERNPELKSFGAMYLLTANLRLIEDKLKSVGG